MNLFISQLQTDPFNYFATVIIIMFSICVHECAHAWVAMKEGDETAMWLGHISLNPRIQMGATSIIILLLFGIAWGAVPYNARNFRKPWSGALMAFAGPLANLILAFLFAGCLVAAGRWMTVPPEQNMVLDFFQKASLLNALLFIFNMLPLPILDGWKVLSVFIPSMARIPPQHANNISWLGMAFLWTAASSYLWFASYVISLTFAGAWRIVI